MIHKGQSNLTAVNNADVVLMIGDSNRQGVATVSDPSITQAGYLSDKRRCKVFYKPDLSLTNNGAFEIYSPGATSTNNNHSTSGRITAYPATLFYGSDVGFVNTYLAGTVKDLVLIKMGVSGSTFNYPFTPENDWQKTTNTLYNTFINFVVKPAINQLLALGYRRYNVKGILINGGTNDVFNYNAANFAAMIPRLVSDIRADLNMPTLRVYWIQIRMDRPGTTPTVISSMQAAIAACGTVGNAAYIPGFVCIDDYQSLTLFDGLHYDIPSADFMGANEATKLLT